MEYKMLEMEGFDFAFDETKCKECGGKCCTGESGYIFVSAFEIQEIAEMLGMSFEDVCLKYVKKVGYKYS
ncbi:MAG: YkgJ family cysteine cluster protein, partial [Helicobacter sp.]|nr:YkgJ family cysteine cluster protein [Helicobacter sp.]